MKKAVVLSLILGTSLLLYPALKIHGDSKPYHDDLRVILKQSYLHPNVEPLLNMWALEAISKSEKTASSEEVVSDLRAAFDDEETLEMFYPSYATFTNEELHQIREIVEMPIWQKYGSDAGSIFMSNMATIQEIIAGIVEKRAVPKIEGAKVSQVVEINAGNYSDEIEKSTLPVVLDVHAKWCQPCKLMGPVLDGLCCVYQGKVKFAKLDFDAHPELAKKYAVTSLPTLLFIRPNHDVAGKTVGFVPQKTVQEKISEFFSALL
ncbi:MAG: thioredoxin domain-containing protein [Chlamydiales bacterium]|nr:thioredoxin domain-containing protein [Chlamydiales bacterium]